ncbi:MAG: M20 family metallopeptidase [Gammaproteobacteria bacterium]|nr:M20 family metallopeptidase [Gammaproteobacteria bacterium]
MDSKQAARERLKQSRDSLVALSHRIHAHPELGFEEQQACGWLAEMFSDAGFSVNTGICDLPTAFSARFGSGPLNIGIMAEYDSLPGVGHACGHNLIAAMSAGAALALAKVADDAGITITVIGTPAEEVGNASGKILLLERGAYQGIHAAMMVHPAPMDMALPHFIAASMFDVHYTGKEAHAAAYPELGINAADALTVAQTSIGLLRQHIRASDRVHGICTHGGEAANIVPAHTSARYMIRSETLDELDDLRVKVRHCFEAGALATGSKLEIRGGDKPYAEVVHDARLASIYRRNAESLGRKFADSDPGAARFSASTDMGNVSKVLPSIHPLIGIDCLPAVNHQPEFTAHCVTAAADQALWDGALSMAWTAIDMAADKDLSSRLLSMK